MLKSYQASIDLEKNVLRIQGREIRFLSEHELPAKAKGPNPSSISNNPGPSILFINSVLTHDSTIVN